MIHFAGVPTLMPTGEVKSYIDALLSPVYYRPAFGAELGASSPPVPTLNWSTVFKPSINQLVWPSGASRWASMYLLVDSVRLEDIMNQCNVSNAGNHVASPAQLKICDSRFGGAPGTLLDDSWTRGEDGSEDYIGLSTAMYALEPRPLSLPYTYDGSAWNASDEKTFWLLPIVDERWLWQWMNIGTDLNWPSWEDAFEKISNALGYPSGAVVDDVNSKYGTPPDFSGFQYANAATMIDAISRLCGMRVTRDVDKKLYVRNATDSVEQYDLNTGADPYNPSHAVWRRVSGGQYRGETPLNKAAAIIPEKMRFVYGDSSSVTQDTASVGSTEWAVDTEGVVFTSVTPASDTAKEDYAERYTEDYLKWISRRMDVAFGGVKSWTMTGIEDFWEISHGPVDGSTPWQFATRIVSVAENIATTQIAKAKDNTTTRMYGRIVGADPANLKAYVFILGWNSDVEISEVPGNLGIPGLPINVVEVCDPTGCGGLARPYAELVRPDDLDVYCWADYMRGTSEPVCRPGYETKTRLWIVDKVCCSLDSCSGG